MFAAEIWGRVVECVEWHSSLKSLQEKKKEKFSVEGGGVLWGVQWEVPGRTEWKGGFSFRQERLVESMRLAMGTFLNEKGLRVYIGISTFQSQK